MVTTFSVPLYCAHTENYIYVYLWKELILQITTSEPSYKLYNGEKWLVWMQRARKILEIKFQITVTQVCDIFIEFVSYS